MTDTPTLDDILKLAEQLSPVDKVRLIERVAPQVEAALQADRELSRQSLRGLWRGVGLSADDIEDARREAWATFPRNDV